MIVLVKINKQQIIQITNFLIIKKLVSVQVLNTKKKGKV